MLARLRIKPSLSTSEHAAAELLHLAALRHEQQARRASDSMPFLSSPATRAAGSPAVAR